MWDELQIQIPASQDPYSVIDAIQKIVELETSANAMKAEAEWQETTSRYRAKTLSAVPGMNVLPTTLCFGDSLFDGCSNFITLRGQFPRPEQAGDCRCHEQNQDDSRDPVPHLHETSAQKLSSPVVCFGQMGSKHFSNN